MRLHWLEQNEAAVPRDNEWLSAAENELYYSFRFDKRRMDWRLGRWTAKRALAAFLNRSAGARPLAEIEIRAAADGAPEAFIEGQPAPAVISISHRAGLAACAVAAPQLLLGCDLEVVEERSSAFSEDYFTQAEQALVQQAGAANRFAALALLWSAKESVLKALRTGLRMDTRSVGVEPVDGWPPATVPPVWRPLTAKCGGQTFNVLFRTTGNVIRTVALFRREAAQPVASGAVRA